MNKIKLIIRDDDVSYFTSPIDLVNLYHGIWDKVPIHLAIIPFLKASGAETPLDKRDGNHHLVTANWDLVKFIKEKQKEGKVKVWMHGITHESKNGQHEMESQIYHQSSILLFEKNKELLEKEFGKIKVFVAPHDRFSANSIKLIEHFKMDICRCFSPLPREFFYFRDEYWCNLLELFDLWLFHRTKYRPTKWMDYGGHKELYSYRIDQIDGDNIDDIIKKHKKGILCITVHNRTLNQDGIEKLKYIIARTK